MPDGRDDGVPADVSPERERLREGTVELDVEGLGRLPPPEGDIEEIGASLAYEEPPVPKDCGRAGEPDPSDSSSSPIPLLPFPNIPCMFVARWKCARRACCC